MASDYITYNFFNGRPVKDVSLKQLEAEREDFTRWTLRAENKKVPNTHTYKHAIATVIALRNGSIPCTLEEEEAAVKLLEKGINFSEKQHEHARINKHRGHNKGRG